MLTGVEELVLFVVNSYKSWVLVLMYSLTPSRHIFVPLHICCHREYLCRSRCCGGHCQFSQLHAFNNSKKHSYRRYGSSNCNSHRSRENCKRSGRYLWV